eukprot:100863_1
MSDQTDLEEVEINWECLKKPLTWIALFGLLYWIVAIFGGFFESGTNSELFLWSIISLGFAVVIQFIIIGLSMAGWKMKETINITYFGCGNWVIRKPALVVFPYTIWILVDVCIHFTALTGDSATMYSVILLLGHGVSLLVISILFYEFKRASKKNNNKIRAINLGFEWVDLCSQIA